MFRAHRIAGWYALVAALLAASWCLVTRVGFAWVPGTDATGSSAPDMYETTNSGRTWKAFGPT